MSEATDVVVTGPNTMKILIATFKHGAKPDKAERLAGSSSEHHWTVLRLMMRADALFAETSAA